MESMYSTKVYIFFRAEDGCRLIFSTGSVMVKDWNDRIRATSSFPFLGMWSTVSGSVSSFSCTPLISLSRLWISGFSILKLAIATAVFEIWYTVFKCFLRASMRIERIICTQHSAYLSSSSWIHWNLPFTQPSHLYRSPIPPKRCAS